MNILLDPRNNPAEEFFSKSKMAAAITAKYEIGHNLKSIQIRDPIFPYAHVFKGNGQILDQCYGPYKVHFIAQENRAGGQNETWGDFIHTYPSFKKYH